MEKQRKNTRRNKGITLIALVITIVILLILAGISIAQLTGTGIFAKAKEAKQKYKDAEDLENKILADYEAQLNSLGKSTVGSGDGTGDGDEQGDDPNVPQTNIDEAKDYVSENTEITDEYGNTLIVPEGFKITDDANNVTEGIVIEDKEGNQFVWIPVGEVIDSTGGKYTITLSRYTFDAQGNATDIGDEQVNIRDKVKMEEKSLSNEKHAIAIDIDKFKASVIDNKGYYIGRFEAREKGTSEKYASRTGAISEKRRRLYV